MFITWKGSVSEYVDMAFFILTMNGMLLKFGQLFLKHAV